MKLAVTGKGGVGKTTVSALLARALQKQGRKVYCIDADPDSNLAACLGYAGWDRIRPLVELKSLIEERTGVKPGTTGGMFRLNPEVSDIPDSYGVDVDGIRVLVAGAVKKGGTGCYCPENTMLRALVSHVLLDTDSDLVLDMEAGVEHLGRGTVSSVDALVVVVNPGRRSIETALRIKRMAGEIGLTKLVAIGNMVRSDRDEAFMREALPGIRFVAMLPFEDSIRDAEMSGLPPFAASDVLQDAICKCVSCLAEETAGQCLSEE